MDILTLGRDKNVKVSCIRKKIETFLLEIYGSNCERPKTRITSGNKKHGIHFLNLTQKRLKQKFISLPIVINLKIHIFFKQNMFVSFRFIYYVAKSPNNDEILHNVFL